MLFVRTENNIAVEYPLSIDNVKARYNVSEIDLTYLSSIGIFPVTPQDVPSVDYKHIVEGKLPECIDGNWVESYKITPKTEEQINSDFEIYKQQTRYSRNIFLEMSDWTQFNDSPLTEEKKNEWKIYRQQLRDMPEQSGFPWEVVWPTQPS
jgi:hypothetical protein